MLWCPEWSPGAKKKGHPEDPTASLIWATGPRAPPPTCRDGHGPVSSGFRTPAPPSPHSKTHPLQIPDLCPTAPPGGHTPHPTSSLGPQPVVRSTHFISFRCLNFVHLPGAVSPWSTELTCSRLGSPRHLAIRTLMPTCDQWSGTPSTPPSHICLNAHQFLSVTKGASSLALGPRCWGRCGILAPPWDSLSVTICSHRPSLPPHTSLQPVTPSS